MNVTTDSIWPWMALLSKKTFDRDENVDVVASEEPGRVRETLATLY